MKFDLSFWRIVLMVSLAKSLVWGKGNDTYFFHIGTFTDGENTALKVVILPVCICIGFAEKGKYE